MENLEKRRTITEVQKSFAQLYGSDVKVIWDILSKDQAKFLRKKIEFLFPDPKLPDDTEDKKKKLKKILAANKEARETLFNAVWEQRKYTNEQSLTSVIFVLVATDETDCDAAVNSKAWSCHPVFRTRRCIVGKKESSNSADCCMIFVDEVGRVYQNWDAYLANNQLPAGVVVAPRSGVYRMRGDSVLLEACLTPAASTEKKALGVMDKVSAVGGLVAAAVLLAPISAPFLAVASATALSCAAYSTARSGAKLVDRSTHEQPISSASVIGVVGGVVGIGATGATSALIVTTNAGQEVNAMAQMAVNSLSALSLFISGTSVCHGIFELVFKVMEEDACLVDFLELSVSLCIFTHSVSNFKLASTIISETSNNTLGAYRETLSNRQRRMFDKVSKETIRMRGPTKGKLDIIRNVNEMPSRQEFNDLYKINSELNKQGVRPSFDPKGQGFLLNNEVRTTGAELRASIQHKVGADVVGQVTLPIPKTDANGLPLRSEASLSSTCQWTPASIEAPTYSGAIQADALQNGYTQDVSRLKLSTLVVGGVKIVLKTIGTYIFTRIVSPDGFKTTLVMLGDNLPGEIMRFCLELTEQFISRFWDELYDFLNIYLSSENVLYKLGVHILENYCGVCEEELTSFANKILLKILGDFRELQPFRAVAELTKCDVCPGYFDICRLASN